MTDDVRLLVASEHNLSAKAAGFLQGDNVEEVEASARSLVRLLGGRREPEPEPPAGPAADPLSAAAAAKAARRRDLKAALTGRPAPLRDQRGRWLAEIERTPVYPAYRDSGAGARQPAARPHDPEREHNLWLLDTLAHRRADVGGGRF